MRRWSSVRRRRPPLGVIAALTPAQRLVSNGAAMSTPSPLRLVTRPSAVTLTPFQAPVSSTSAANVSAAAAVASSGSSGASPACTSTAGAAGFQGVGRNTEAEAAPACCARCASWAASRSEPTMRASVGIGLR
jgi:hypothetical protein